MLQHGKSKQLMLQADAFEVRQFQPDRYASYSWPCNMFK